MPTVVPRRGIGRNAPVIALRRRDVVAVGSLSAREVALGECLVSGSDVTGGLWLVPAEAVWRDASANGRGNHPCGVGLATAPDRANALVAGVSDRLGWEAATAFGRGNDLPAAPPVGDSSGRLVVLDGRLDHDVPTVVVLGEDIARWGAGATWGQAMRRALYGSDTVGCVPGELDAISAALGLGGLTIVGVDLGTVVLERAGIARVSVQLMMPL